MLNKDYEKLQEVIGHKFNNLEVLIEALTHKSRLNEKCNERLEFLGDSILSSIVTQYLFLNFPQEPEGKMSKMRSQIVSAKNLSVWAKEISLGQYVLLGKSEETPASRQRESLLCDVFEAVIGALFVDGGYFAAKNFILKFLDVCGDINIADYKSMLQENVQSLCKELPHYKILREFGPEHDKKFEAAVYVNKKLLGRGCGRSKKEAQQAAAKEALQRQVEN